MRKSGRQLVNQEKANKQLVCRQVTENQHTTSKSKAKDNDFMLFPETNRFKELVTKYQHIYIDKTSFIRQVLQKHNEQPILLITRPSGWGKTVNLTMLKNFLQTKVNECGKSIFPHPNLALFQGGKCTIKEEISDDKNINQFHYLQQYQKLMEHKGIDENSRKGRAKIIEIIKKNIKNTKKISKQYIVNPLKICSLNQNKLVLVNQNDFGVHPVIFVDFSKITKDTLNGIKYELFTIIHQAYLKHSYLQRTNQHAQYNLQLKHIEEIIKAPEKVHWSPLDNLFMNLKETLEDHFKNSCYIMVDNYDYPVLKLLKSENMSEIRQMAALIASLFTDFGNCEYIPPSTTVNINMKKRGRKPMSTRAILMGKINIFSTYLSRYMHRGIGDISFQGEFGMNKSELSEKFIPQILNTLKQKTKITHFDLKSSSQYKKTKESLISVITNWYGGYIQQLSEGHQEKSKYGFGNVWNYMRQYISSGIVPKGTSFTVNANQDEIADFDETWFFRRIFKSIKLSKLFEFHLTNPPSIKLLVSDFLSPDCRASSYLSGPQIIHLAYSMGYLTGIFLPISASQTYIVKVRFPNLEVQNKFKSAILQRLQPFFNPSQQISTNQEPFNLIDAQKFRVSIETLINKLTKQEIPEPNTTHDQCCSVYFMGLILYKILNEPTCGYVSISDLDNSSAIIDNIYVNQSTPDNHLKNDNQTIKGPTIVIDMRFCKTSKQTEIDVTFLAALRDTYESTNTLQRLLDLNTKDISLQQTFVKVRVGVIAHWNEDSSHKMFLLHDLDHSYRHILNLMNFFQSKKKKSKWKKFLQSCGSTQTFDFREYSNYIKVIANGKGDEVYEQIKRMMRKSKEIGLNEGDYDGSQNQRRKKIELHAQSSDEEKMFQSRNKGAQQTNEAKDEWGQAYLSVLNQLKSEKNQIKYPRGLAPEKKIQQLPKNIEQSSIYQSKPYDNNGYIYKQKTVSLSNTPTPTNMDAIHSYNPYLSENAYNYVVPQQEPKKTRAQLELEGSFSRRHKSGSPIQKFRYA